MRAEGDKRWQTLARTLRQALIQHDIVGLRGVGSLPHGDKTEGFAIWLREELRQKVFGLDGRWVRPYVQEATAIAQKHALQHVNGQVDPGRTTSMENLAVSELRGITEAAQQQLTRVMTHAMMASCSPTKAANALAGVIRTMRQRTRAMSEHIIAKTHATSTLSAYRDAGVTHVGVIPERKSKVHTKQTAHGKVLVKDADVDLDELWAATEALVEKAEVNRDYDVVELANRSRDASTVFIDKHVPEVLKDTGIRPDQTLPWHELAEWTMMNRGLSYLPAHKIATQIEKRRVEQIKPGAWDEYQEEMGGLISDAEERGYGREPPNQDQRVFDAAVGYTSGLTGKKSSRIFARKRFKPIEEVPSYEEVDVVTAGDNDVCIICEDISDDGPYELDEAEELIPAHPFCRCSFVPADKYERDALPAHDKDRSREAPGAISYHGGEFAPEGAAWTGEQPLKGSQGDPGLVSTALTIAKGRAGSKEREEINKESYNYQRIDLDQAKKDPELFEGMVNTFRNAELFPYMRSSDFNGDAEHDSRSIIDRIKSNLHVMWNDTSQASKDLWRHWYVGAHAMITERMKQYPNVGRAAMTAMYAAQSPNTMWDVNVHLGDRLLDTVFHHASDKWDKGMADAAQGQLERAEKAVGKAKDKARVQANVDKMRKTFAEVKKAGSFDKQVDDHHRAAWVKLWNDVHDDTPVYEVGIDGKMGKPIKNKGLDDNGEPSDLSGRFGGLDRIENALYALRSNGNVKMISDALGERHKVRSFYNNMLDPHSANDDVTIDTHAAGGAWLDMVGSKSPLLGQMFGSPMKGFPAPKSSRLGVMGTYPFYAQAYREVAREVGLDRGRELQSIIWEHKIALFRGAPDAKKELIKQAWQRFHDDSHVTLEQTQQRVMRIAKAGYNVEERRKRTRDEAEFDNQLDEA
jgi:hypothetical protein